MTIQLTGVYEVVSNVMNHTAAIVRFIDEVH